MTSSNRPLTASTLVASQTKARAPVACAIESSFSTVRAASATDAPSPAKRRAIAELRPGPAPTINTTLFTSTPDQDDPIYKVCLPPRNVALKWIRSTAGDSINLLISLSMHNARHADPASPRARTQIVLWLPSQSGGEFVCLQAHRYAVPVFVAV